jgi:hypothetical protein
MGSEHTYSQLLISWVPERRGPPVHCRQQLQREADSEPEMLSQDFFVVFFLSPVEKGSPPEFLY